MYLITCIDDDYGIGNDGKLLYHIETDMELFADLTKRSGIVIMGMETYKSIGKPLPERTNIVLTRTEQHSDSSNLRFVSSIDTIIDNPEFKNAFVIGGAAIYQLLSPFCDTAYVTTVFSKRPHDKKFPFNFHESEWETTYASNLAWDEKEQVVYRFLKLKRKEKSNGRRY